jgi:hypothetical protein
VLLAGEASYESLVHAYRVVKQAVARNSDVCIRLALLTRDETANARWLQVVQAVDTFLGKPCAVIGPVERAEELAGLFLAGRLWDKRGEDRVATLVSPLVGRWTRGLAQLDDPHRVLKPAVPSADVGMSGGVDSCR